MSGFLSHLAARGMGQAGSVHSAARLPYASPPALVEAGGEAMALPPSLPSLPLGGPPQELAQGPVPARPDGGCRRGGDRRPDAALAIAATALDPGAGSQGCPSRDDLNAREAAQTIDAGRRASARRRTPR